MNYRIEDLPMLEKPREKALKYGIHALSDAELLAILLRTGTRNCSALNLSQALLKEYSGLDGLFKARISKLKTFDGIGEVKAITLVAALELGSRLTEAKEVEKKQIHESKEVFLFYRHLIMNLEQEQFYGIFLDSHNYILGTKLLFVGTANQSLVHPRDLFKEAILHNAVKIICFHNHPSGNVFPSLADVELTKKLKEIGDLLGVSLIDHVILAKDKYYSFLEHRKDIWQ